MAIISHKSSLAYVTQFAPVRCDTHFRHHIEKADEFFKTPGVEWVAMGSILENVRNGVNVGTDYYSMDDTEYLYISVSQVKEYGLSAKNQAYLKDDVRSRRGFFEIEPDMVLVTRSGTIGIALSSNHTSFKLDEYTYVPSGFLITAKVKSPASADAVANYINLADVQTYLTAMAAGACQRNISQDTINSLPIPAVLVSGEANLDSTYAEYQRQSLAILGAVAEKKAELRAVKEAFSTRVKDRIRELNQLSG